MPVPQAVTRFNKQVLNPVLKRLAGHGPFVEIEHMGRRSGTVYRTPIMAFRDGQDDRTVTIALTYGPKVDWLRNVRAAGGCRMHIGPRLVTLGAPVDLTEQEGLRRMPNPERLMLPRLGCHDFVALPVLEDRPWPGGRARS